MPSQRRTSASVVVVKGDFVAGDGVGGTVGSAFDCCGVGEIVAPHSSFVAVQTDEHCSLVPSLHQMHLHVSQV